MNPITILGILSGACFAIAGLPSALRAHRQGFSHVPAMTSWPIFVGVLFSYAYLILTYGFNPLLLLTHFVEAACWGTVLGYTHFPTKK